MRGGGQGRAGEGVGGKGKGGATPNEFFPPSLRPHTHTHINTRVLRQEKGQEHGVFLENLPAGKTLPEMELPPEQQYLYLEAPGLGGKGVQR